MEKLKQTKKMVVIPEELYMRLQRGRNRKQPCTSREKENKQVC